MGKSISKWNTKQMINKDFPVRCTYRIASELNYEANNTKSS